MAILFYILFLGASYMAGPTASFGDRLDGIVLAYILWIIIQSTMNIAGRDLESERSHGTMEQLMMTSYGITTILLVRTWVELIFTFVQCLVLTVILSWLTGSVLHFSWAICLPVFTVILASNGLGYLLGSLIIIFRRLEVARSFFVFALLFLIATPFENWGLTGIFGSSILPIAPSAIALRLLMVQERFDWLACSLAIANGVLYLTLGIMMFQWALHRAKQRGSVSSF
jgi:ABC-2 type transport system permease protein